MADVLLGSDRRLLIAGYGLPPPPAESLLGRLDQIDLRLRQLEEQRQGTAKGGAGDESSPAAAGKHKHTKSLPTALQNGVQVKGDLMERLNLLESRIRQLSCAPAEDRAWSEPPPLPEPCKEAPPPVCAAAGRWSAVQFLQTASKPNPTKKQNLKEAKCACEKEKRKAERRKAGRRWFTVIGC
uniref:Uncharacterized protein n=1 Tax=Leersia perrieri TaxID=77586 RepID=A0A0D9WL89_9ORYZ